MSDVVWTPELEEWLYGPPWEEGDEPLSTGELYRQQEEEERFRWIPGYAALVQRYLDELRKWHASWIPGEEYPPEPEAVSVLKAKTSEHQQRRALPPWEVR